MGNSLDQTVSDLDRSVAFVIRKIDEAAQRSGQPLDPAARELLLNLPTKLIVPPPFLEEEAVPPPRDLVYEGLCWLGKAAYTLDSKRNPVTWNFAAAVFRLNRHPMLWLLEWAGVKKERRWWDGCAVIIAALLLVLSVFAIGICYSITQHDGWKAVLWLGIVCVYIGLVVGVGVAWNRFQQMLVRRTIENYRAFLEGDSL